MEENQPRNLWPIGLILTFLAIATVVTWGGAAGSGTRPMGALPMFLDVSNATAMVNPQTGTISCTIPANAFTCSTSASFPAFQRTPSAITQFTTTQTGVTIDSHVGIAMEPENWTGGMPNAETELYNNTRHRILITTTQWSGAQLYADCIKGSSSSTAYLALEWSTDNSTWHLMGTELAPPGGNVTAAETGCANGREISAPGYQIDPNSQSPLFVTLRVVGRHGGGSSDIPEFSNIAVIFSNRAEVQTTYTTSLTTSSISYICTTSVTNVFQSPGCGFTYIVFLPFPTGTWSNQPTALTEIFGDTTHRVQVDMTQFHNVQLSATVTVHGGAGSKLWIQFSIDGGTTWTDLCASQNPSVTLNTIGLKLSTTCTFNTAASTSTTLLRLVGTRNALGGAGNPAFTIIYPILTP